MKRALITGITGQDGSYLADLLLEKGYEVHGIIRRASTFNTSRIDHLYADPHVNGVRMFLHYGDLSDSVNLVKLLYKLKPDEIYHLGAQSHVRVSFDIPEYTSDVTGVGTIRILEAIREAGLRSRFFQASSSEIFGKAQQTPQTEQGVHCGVLTEEIRINDWHRRMTDANLSSTSVVALHADAVCRVIQLEFVFGLRHAHRVQKCLCD